MNVQKPGINGRIVHSLKVIDILNSIPTLDSVTSRELRTIARFMSFKRIKVGTVIFQEGDASDFVCFVVSGRLEIVKKSATGQDTVIATVGRGRSIGEMGIVDEYSRSATVRTIAPTDMVIVTRRSFILILSEYPETGVKILMGISRLINMNLRQTSSRLADYLSPLT